MSDLDDLWESALSHAGKHFAYEPLGEREFRVLLLHPGEGTDTIMCQVVKQSLDHIVIPYSAVSYTWGDPARTSPVRCLMTDQVPAHVLVERGQPMAPGDGRIGELQATANLVAALRQFRYRDQVPALWVDAICIDQGNVDERNQQVRVMPEIYIRAAKTLIWLGEASDVSGIGLALVEDLFHAPRHDDTAVLLKELRPETVQPLTDHWRGLADILRRPWFTRAWVRQELTFSRDAGLVCGEDTLAWEKFEAVVPGLISSQATFSDRADHRYGLHHTTMLRTMRAMVRESKADSILRNELLVVLWYCRECGATDPRDKVIALLNLCSQAQQQVLPRLDYTLTTEKLYLHVALATIVMYRNLNVLSHAGLSMGAAHASLPSWVPDWSVASPVNIIDSPLPDYGYRASGDRRPDPQFDPEQPGRIGLKGRRVGDVRRVADVTPSFEHLFTTQRDRLTPSGPPQLRLQEWAMSLEDLRASNDTEALWRTLCANKARSDHHGVFWQDLRVAPWPGDGRTAPSDYAESFRAWCVWYMRRPGQDAETSFVHMENLLEWQSAMIAAAANRRFGVTTGGHLFLGPRDAAPGDVLCVLNGGNVPFLLRDGGDGTYTLVGECYAHGLMNGQAMSDESLAEEDFVII